MAFSLLTSITYNIFIGIKQIRKFIFLRTFSTIWKEGCPRRLCHLSKDTLLTPKTCLDADDGGRGYSPL
jgi:hypothetical protein